MNFTLKVWNAKVSAHTTLNLTTGNFPAVVVVDNPCEVQCYNDMKIPFLISKIHPYKLTN